MVRFAWVAVGVVMVSTAWAEEPPKRYDCRYTSSPIKIDGQIGRAHV